MMSTPKPLASLSGGLLARKGAARPAMRPQGYASLTGGQSLEDLGWNDMGSADAAQASAPQPQIQPQFRPEPVPLPIPAPEPVAEEPAVLAPAVPQVLVEREALAKEFDPPASVRPVSVATATRLRRETSHVAKSAFTLRLDQERHLRLRLASALTGKSAQVLVTQALDHLLGSLSDVEALVAQLPPAKRTRAGKQGK